MSRSTPDTRAPSHRDPKVLMYSSGAGAAPRCGCSSELGAGCWGCTRWWRRALLPLLAGQGGETCCPPGAPTTLGGDKMTVEVELLALGRVAEPRGCG